MQSRASTTERQQQSVYSTADELDEESYLRRSRPRIGTFISGFIRRGALASFLRLTMPSSASPAHTRDVSRLGRHRGTTLYATKSRPSGVETLVCVVPRTSANDTVGFFTLKSKISKRSPR